MSEFETYKTETLTNLLDGYLDMYLYLSEKGYYEELVYCKQTIDGITQELNARKELLTIKVPKVKTSKK